MIREGKFREDLFYRLNVFPIEIPPLRERREDIPLLADYFVSKLSPQIKKKIKPISPRAMELLANASWPGNVRELQNIVERAIILSRGETLDRADFELPGLTAAPSSMSEATERQQIEDALRESRGRISGADGAAQALGVAPSTLDRAFSVWGVSSRFAGAPTLTAPPLTENAWRPAPTTDFRPFLPSGSASPTRWRNIAFPRPRLASMTAAASA